MAILQKFKRADHLKKKVVLQRSAKLPISSQLTQGQKSDVFSAPFDCAANRKSFRNLNFVPG